MKYFIAIFFGVSISNIVNAQNIFLVYKINGKAFYNGSKGKVKVLIGNTFNESDNVILEPKSKITFLCNNYIPFEVEKEGVVELKKIAVNCKNTNQNNDINFFKFVWEQFSHPHLDPIKNREKYFHNLGAPIRSNHKEIDIKEFYSDFSMVEGSKIKLNWNIVLPKKYYKRGSYKFMLYNQSSKNKSVEQFSIYNSGSFDFAIYNTNLIYPAKYDWGITFDSLLSKGNSNGITIYSKSQYDSILNSIDKNIEKNIDEAERSFRKGVALGLLHFYKESFSYYKEALKLEPENELYKTNVEILKHYFQF